MKLKSRIFSIYLGIKNSVKRFPITIIISSLLAILLIYTNEVYSKLSMVQLDRLIRVNFIMGMGILLSLNIDLFKERFFKEDKFKALISHLLGIVFLVLYYQFLLKKVEVFTMIRYTGIIIFLFIMFFYLPRLNRKIDDYEYYVIDIFYNMALTVIYSIVLIWGIFAIIFTINSLFDANIKWDFYYYTLIVVYLIFAISFFLSKVPVMDQDFTGYDYSKSLRILLSYIVIPLISVYTVILYVYFFKILLSWEWPKGLVSHLVLWYSSISVGIIFLINKITDRDRVSNRFKQIFPKLILPILLMMVISIGQRVNQYGITENRYYILVLGIWVAAMMLYISFKKPIKTIIIPISLSLIVLNSVVGPLSGFTISKYSQNKRLNNILKLNDMIKDNKIVKDPNVSKYDQEEINNIIYYFNNNHSLEDIKVLEKGFKTSDMEEIFGFPYEPNLREPMGEREYFYLSSNISENIINVKDYDYYLNIYSWEAKSFNIDDLIINYNSSKNTLTIKENNNILKEIDVKEIVQDMYEQLNEDEKETEFIENIDNISYEKEEEAFNYKIIFYSLSGKKDGNGDIENLESTEFLLFVKMK